MFAIPQVHTDPIHLTRRNRLGRIQSSGGFLDTPPRAEQICLNHSKISKYQWIGLRENLQETMVFTCFYHQI